MRISRGFSFKTSSYPRSRDVPPGDARGRLRQPDCRRECFFSLKISTLCKFLEILLKKALKNTAKYAIMDKNAAAY